MKKTPLVIYHGPGCMDGAGAALAAFMKFGEDAEYRPAQYGDPAPSDGECASRDVYVLDFSYPRAELERMWGAGSRGEQNGGLGARLLVLDHHKTAKADLDDLPFAVFDMGKSGAVMAWEHFHCSGLATDYDNDRPTSRVPDLIRYICDRDLWRWRLPQSKEVSTALAASGAGEDFRKLHKLLEVFPKAFPMLILEGAAILRYQAQQVARIAASAEEVDVDGVPVLAATSPVLQSEVGEALALAAVDRGLPAVGCVYYRDGKAGRWRVSLRSRPVDGHTTPNVSELAKRFGGGGHAQAAGFESERAPRPWRPMSCPTCRRLTVTLVRTDGAMYQTCSACAPAIKKLASDVTGLPIKEKS